MGRLRAAILNVNEGGAQLCDAVGLSVGDPVQFQVLHDRISAVVKWATAGKAGLAFHPKISIDQIDAIRSRFHAQSAPPAGTSGLTQIL